jgi:hypothetical protein
VRLAWDQIISGLAAIEAKLQKKDWSTKTFVAIETLLDFVAAGLEGPAAPRLLAALQPKATVTNDVKK